MAATAPFKLAQRLLERICDEDAMNMLTSAYGVLERQTETSPNHLPLRDVRSAPRTIPEKHTDQFHSPHRPFAAQAQAQAQALPPSPHRR